MENNCCCAPKPCPNCGHCPCCGRGAYPYIQQPWYPPQPGPIWMYTPTYTGQNITTGILHSTANVTVTYNGVVC